MAATKSGRNANRFNLKTVVGWDELCSAPWLSWEAAMRILTLALAAMVLIGAGAKAQHIKDPPWNPEHIDHLPADVGSAVMAKCAQRPDAGHYFATYFHDEITCTMSTCTAARRHTATARNVCIRSTSSRRATIICKKATTVPVMTEGRPLLGVSRTSLMRTQKSGNG
jgi:hypothetical protein